MDELDALYAFLAAMVATAILTHAANRAAVRVGAIDVPRDRGLSESERPRLGGLAILGGVLVAALVWLPAGAETRGILAGALIITAVGAIDDVRDLPAGVKLLGQVVAVLVPVLAGVRVEDATVPFLGRLDFGAELGSALTVIGIVAVVNVVNLSDGVDGLASGVCAIAAVTFSIIAWDLREESAAILAALTAGAATGFLVHNFHPGRAIMGDSGSNLLGFLLGCVIVQGALKTNAAIALVLPLVIFAVPVLDTSFVVLKRIKYRRPIYAADAWHFHHRFANIGFSQRRTVLYLYGWTALLALLALAIRFVPYSDGHGNFDTGWSLVLGAFLLAALATSVYLVYTLEILKLRRLRAAAMRRADPETSEHEIDEDVLRELETGEWEAITPPADAEVHARPRA